jgi:hypothetical protein
MFSQMLGAIKRGDDRALNAVGIVILPLIYVPGWAYRVILKSTLWVWWILLVIGGAPKLEGGIEGLRADAYRKSRSWVSIALAVYAVAGFAGGTMLKPMVENRLSVAPLLVSTAMLMLIDWTSISAYQWVNAIAAILTLGTVLWTHALVVDSGVPGREEKVTRSLPRLGHFVKLKSGFGALSIALLMVYVALYANAVHSWAPVSPWVAGWLNWVYGANAHALVAQL